MCPENNNRISAKDFACVGDVAVHCDLKKLCIAISQADDFDVRRLLCGFYTQAMSIWDEIKTYFDELKACEENPDCTTPPVEPDNYAEKLSLICGGDFDGCCGQTYHHFGLKRMLVYYSYAKYLYLNQHNDTPSGLKQKTSEFTLPVPLSEIKDLSDQYRTMGYDTWKNLQKFICANKNIFTSDSCKCEQCAKGTTAKGYGIEGSVIRKNNIIRRHNGRLR